MKKATLCMVYAAAIVIGILLLVFNRSTFDPVVSESLRGLVIAGGVTFIIAGAVDLYYAMKVRKDAQGMIVNTPWYNTLMGVAGIFWGIVMLVSSTFFAYNIAVTLGIALIIAGLAQGMWIVNESRPYGAAGWWYVVPFATLCAGIVDLTLINDYSNFAQSGATACIVSGILLLCYGVNGFISVNRRKRVNREVIDSVNEIARENRKVS